MQHFHHSVKSGKRGSGRDHSLYIARRGRVRHTERDDVLDEGCGNLPGWANDDPARFWSAADRFERVNGSVYREHEISLPNVMTNIQLVELARGMVKELAGAKAFQYAVHMGMSSGTGEFNPHLHLMVSDRLNDGIEREPEQMFRRYNAKRPERGGCRKDSGGRSPYELSQQLVAVREKAARMQNDALARHGHRGRVDHRSNRERGVDREPGRHVGPTRAG